MKVCKMQKKVAMIAVFTANLLNINVTSALAETQSAKGQYPNSAVIYGASNSNCERSMKKTYFCDLCWTTMLGLCPGCFPAQLPPPVDLGIQKGKPVTKSVGQSACVTAKTEVEARAQIPTGATDVKLQSGATGTYCFTYNISYTTCEF